MTEIIGTRESRWPDPAAGPWALRLTFGVAEGRPAVVGVEIYAVDPAAIAAAAQGWPKMPSQWFGDPVPVTTAGIRIPLAERLRLYLADARRSAEIRRDAATAPPWLTLEEYRAQGERTLRALGRAPGSRGRPPVLTLEHFQAVADVYSAASRAGRSPVKAVAQEFKVPHSTAAHWVERARKRFGLLPPTTPGKASGRARRRTQ